MTQSFDCYNWINNKLMTNHWTVRNWLELFVLILLTYSLCTVNMSIDWSISTHFLEFVRFRMLKKKILMTDIIDCFLNLPTVSTILETKQKCSWIEWISIQWRFLFILNAQFYLKLAIENLEKRFNETVTYTILAVNT